MSLPRAKGATMKEQKKVRGILEKHPGSVWSIRCVAANGRYFREKIGTFAGATKALIKRRNDAQEGIKLPPNLRKRAASFEELADDAATYITSRYARPADDVARIELLKTRFTGRADAIRAAEVMNVLDSLTAEKKCSPSTRNRRHNLISLA